MTVSPTFHIRFVALGGVTREVTIAQGKAWPRESVDALGLKVLRGPISWRLSLPPGARARAVRERRRTVAAALVRRPFPFGL